jgi:hypothetical protein
MSWVTWSWADSSRMCQSRILLHVSQQEVEVTKLST